MSSPAERVIPYGALGSIPGGNSYGIDPAVWGKMTQKQKQAFRQRIYWERLREQGPEVAAAKHKELRNGSPEKVAKRKKRAAEYKKENRPRHNERNRDYKQRRRSKEAMLLNPDKIYLTILKAIPGWMPKHQRDDIASMICLEVMEQRAKLNEVPKLVKAAVTKFHRVMETYKTKSLDAPMPGSDRGEAWISRLADPSTLDSF